MRRAPDAIVLARRSLRGWPITRGDHTATPQFSASTQEVLTSATSTPEEQKLALVQALNNILKGVLIYETVRFAGVALSPETLALRSQNPTGKDLIRLNRLLLQDAYPLEIAKLPQYKLVDENVELQILADYDPLLKDRFEEYIQITEKTNPGKRSSFNDIPDQETRDIHVSGLVLKWSDDLSQSKLMSVTKRGNIENLYLCRYSGGQQDQHPAAVSADQRDDLCPEADYYG